MLSFGVVVPGVNSLRFGGDGALFWCIWVIVEDWNPRRDLRKRNKQKRPMPNAMKSGKKWVTNPDEMLSIKDADADADHRSPICEVIVDFYKLPMNLECPIAATWTHRICFRLSSLFRLLQLPM